MKHSVLMAVVLFLSSLLPGSAAAGGIDCASPYLGVDYVICGSSGLIALTDTLNEAFLETKLRLSGDDRQAFVQDQKVWIGQYGLECGLPYRGRAANQLIADAQACVEKKIRSRIDYVKHVMAARGRQNGGFDCERANLSVDFVICSDARIVKAVEYMGEIYWRGRSGLQGDRKDAYVSEQRSWVDGYSRKCGVPGIGRPDDEQIAASAACVQSSVTNRTDELKRIIADLFSDRRAATASTPQPSRSDSPSHPPDRFDRAAQRLVVNLAKCSAKKLVTDSFDDPVSKTFADFLFVAVVENRIQERDEVIRSGALNLIKQNLKENGHPKLAEALADAKLVACIFQDVDVEALVRP